MIYWYDDVAHYSKAFQGFVVTIGWCTGIAGVAMYTSCLKEVPYRRFFFSLQVVQVQRLNVKASVQS